MFASPNPFVVICASLAIIATSIGSITAFTFVCVSKEQIDFGIRNSTSLGIQLKQNASAFKEGGIVVKWQHTSKGNTWSFCIDRQNKHETGQNHTTSQSNPSDPSHPSGSTRQSTNDKEELVKPSTTSSEAFTQARAQDEAMNGVKGSNGSSASEKTSDNSSQDSGNAIPHQRRGEATESEKARPRWWCDHCGMDCESDFIWNEHQNSHAASEGDVAIL